MDSPNLGDLKARIEAVKAAPMFAKSAAAELALGDFLKYLAVLELRISLLENKGGV
jgi:hypothetical protein